MSGTNNVQSTETNSGNDYVTLLCPQDSDVKTFNVINGNLIPIRLDSNSAIELENDSFEIQQFTTELIAVEPIERIDPQVEAERNDLEPLADFSGFQANTSSSGCNILQPEDQSNMFQVETGSSRKRKELGNWKSNRNKKLREQGKKYIGWKRCSTLSGKCNKNDTQKESRKLGPPCTSQKCMKHKKKQCHLLTEANRVEIFQYFWEMTWGEKEVFISSLVDKSETKKHTKEAGKSRRTASLQYHLKLHETRISVCKKMFLSTLAIGEWSVHSWIKKHNETTQLTIPPVNQPVISPTPCERNEMLNNFIDSLPKLPSHYCRKDSSKLYLEPIKNNMVEVYREYVAHCKASEKHFFTRPVFDKAIKKKYRFSRPKERSM